MKIWTYAHVSRDIIYLHNYTQCPFCGIGLTYLESDFKRESGVVILEEIEFHNYVRVCPGCGWWQVKNETRSVKYGDLGLHIHSFASSGALIELDLNNIADPLNELNRYLQNNYKAGQFLQAKQFEDLVTVSFGSLGYRSVVTGYSTNGGGQVFLSNGTDLIGVLVSAEQGLIKAEQLRSLAGAIVHKGLTQGMVVATIKSPNVSIQDTTINPVRYSRIELIDTQKIFKALQFTQRRMYRDKSVMLRQIPLAGKLIEVENAYYENYFGP